MSDAFPDYEPHFADTLCQGCQEVDAEPYESYCDDCLGIIAQAAGDLCSVPAALEDEDGNGKCRDCGKRRPILFLGRCADCDLARFPPSTYKSPSWSSSWSPPPPPSIPPFEEEVTNHPQQARTLTNA